VLVILGILASIFILKFQEYIQSAQCNVNSSQHDTIVSMIDTTFAMCDVQGWTYLNQPPGTSCRTRNPSISTNYASRNDPITEKCIGKWDCSISYCPFGGGDPSCHLPPNAMFYQSYIMSHVRAELNQDNSSDSTIRGDQYMNFEACSTPNPNISESVPNDSIEGQKRRNWNNMQKNCKSYIGITNIDQNRTDGGIRISTYLGQCDGGDYKITIFFWPDPYPQSGWPEGWVTTDSPTWNGTYEVKEVKDEKKSTEPIEAKEVKDEKKQTEPVKENNSSDYLSDDGYLYNNDVY
jgi:hypothetical protein